MRAIDWVDGGIRIIDQTALPARERWLDLSDVEEVIDAIVRLAVRGAPALGVAGAMGVALAARTCAGDKAAFADAVRRLAQARPTAVNLARGVRRAAEAIDGGPDAVLAQALALRDEELAASQAMAHRGADLVMSIFAGPVRLLTHCNTGTLACVSGGTALGVVIELHKRGRLAGVVVSETRPLLQGARLTTWELAREGIGFRLAVDSAGAYLMARGEVDAVIVGADRICANGDVVNKVGTYSHALGARAAGIPFLVVAPESTVDDSTPDGASVEIEDRGPGEVIRFATARVAPKGVAAVNPAFDVTGHHLVTAIVTDQRVIRPA